MSVSHGSKEGGDRREEDNGSYNSLTKCYLFYAHKIPVTVV